MGGIPREQAARESSGAWARLIVVRYLQQWDCRHLSTPSRRPRYRRITKKESPDDQADFEVNRVSTRSRERVLPVARRVRGGVALGPDAVKGKTPDGFIEMHEVQAAYIGSGSGGAGNLSFRGVQYAFDVGGVGVGGIGLSTIEATGEVYNLRDLGQFPGT